MGIIFLRTVIIYAVLLIAMRLMGKRQIGELELSDLVIAVLISNIAAHPLQDIGIPIMNGLLPIVTLLCLDLDRRGADRKVPARQGGPFVRQAKFHCGPGRHLPGGDGAKLPLARRQALRAQGIMDISQVEYAILETSGKVSIILFPAERTPTAGKLNVEEDNGCPVILISNGRLRSQDLQVAGKDEKRLQKQLKAHGVSSPREVYFMTVNNADQIFFVKTEAGK